MKPLLSFGLCLFWSIQLMAQDQATIDSLQQVLGKEIGEKEKVDVLVAISYEYSKGYDSETAIYANQAIELANKINYAEGRLDATYQLGWMTMGQRNLAQADLLFRQVVEESNDIDYLKGKANGLYGLGALFDQKDQYQVALEHYLQSLELAEQLGDKSRMSKCYHNIAVAYRHLYDYDKAFANYFKSSELDKELGDKSGLSVTYGNMGMLFKRQGNYEKALEYTLLSLEIKEELGEKRRIAHGYNSLGNIYSNQGDYAEALKHFFSSLEIYKELGDKGGISGAYNSIGNMFKIQKNYAKALEFYSESLTLEMEAGNKTGLSRSHNNIGLVFDEQRNYPKALKHYGRSLELDRELGNRYGVALTSYNIATLYATPNAGEFSVYNIDRALKYFSESIAISRDIDANTVLSYSLNGVAEVYKRQGQWKLARPYAEEAYHTALERGNARSIYNAAERVAIIEERLGNYKEAYDAYVIFKWMSDSLFNEEQTKKLTRLEADYEFGQERDSIQFANERERLILETDLARRKGIQNTIILGLGLAVIIILVVIFFYRRLRMLNIEVVDQRNSLEKLNEAKDKLFSIVAHDLRSPMVGLQGIGEKLEFYIQENLQDKLLEMGAKIDQSIDHLNHLLNNLLNWAATQTGGIPHHPQILKLKTLLKENIDLYESLASGKGIEIGLMVNDDQRVYADYNAISTIIRNLLSNAIKFTEQGGRVEVLANENDQEMVISIKDQGQGMSRDQIFSIFNDDVISTSGTAGEEGFGLGLKVSNEFVKINHGRIEVESEIGEGCIFKVFLPKEPVIPYELRKTGN